MCKQHRSNACLFKQDRKNTALLKQHKRTQACENNREGTQARVKNHTEGTTLVKTKYFQDMSFEDFKKYNKFQEFIILMEYNIKSDEYTHIGRIAPDQCASAGCPVCCRR